MKKIIKFICGITTVIPSTTWCQSNFLSQNKGHNIVGIFTSADGSDVNGMSLIEIYDDFGRNEESIQVGASPMGKDVVKYKQYDMTGRVWREWLEGISPNSNGKYVAQQDCMKYAILINNDSVPFATYTYEPTLLDRVVTYFGAGSKWYSDDKKVEIDYQANSYETKYKCVLYKFEGLQENGISIRNLGFWPKGSLLVVETKDEDNRSSLEFKDAEDKVILVRKIISENNFADTYFIYDNLGKLLAVLPPNLCGNEPCGSLVSNDYINKYAYLYLYDNLERVKAKKMPGADWVRYSYDGADRILYSQDGRQRQHGEKSFHIYDVFGRECITGVVVGNVSDETNITAIPYCSFAGIANEWKGYTITNLQISNARLGKVNYYDDYQFISLFPENILPNSTMSLLSQGGETDCTTGLITGCITARMDSMYTEVFDYSIKRYDSRGRLAHTETTNIKGYQIVDISYNHLDMPLERFIRNHSQNMADITEHYIYGYDHASRPTSTTYQLNSNAAIVIQQNSYDELGRLQNKLLGNTLAINYTYNVRSWLKNITSDGLFNETIYYNEDFLGNTPQYSGNISVMSWMADSKSRAYQFKYDGLSRLTSATYYEDGIVNNNRYLESFQYDKMGNILYMQRHGRLDDNKYGLMDDVTFSYNGNQLVRADNDIDDGPTYTGAFHFLDAVEIANEYEYDQNGNMTKDLNRGISSIQYNLLNLQSMIRFTGDNYQKYVYDADGNKLQTVHYEPISSIFDDGAYDEPYPGEPIIDLSQNGVQPLGVTGDIVNPSAPTPKRPGEEIENVAYDITTTSYCGNIIYHNNERIVLIPEGYITFSGSTPHYHYYLKDHLGNVRMVVSESGSVEQVNHYYAFGGLMGESIGGDVQRFKYNGKELDRMSSLDWYDYGARHYDAMRFTTMDPMAEKYYSISPYAYCLNNPITYVDPNGQEPTDEEAARIAAHVYGDRNDDILIGKWRVSSEDFGIKNYAGLKSRVYERIDDDGNLEYVYATAGTEKRDIKDWIADVTQVIGLSAQYQLSVENARKISKELVKKGLELNFVGHSLGGGEAALNSFATYGEGKGRKAFTFNAAGVSFFTKIREGGSNMIFKSEGSVNAYITITDPLNIIQNLSLKIPKVNGHRIYVLPRVKNGHSIDNFIRNKK